MAGDTQSQTRPVVYRESLLSRTRDRFASVILLTPSLLLMALVFGVGLLIFFRYSFYRFDLYKLYPDYSFDTYFRFLRDRYYWGVIFDTFSLATIVTVLCLAISYPAAYAICKFKSPTARQWASVIIFIPLLVSVVVRTYGWLVILSKEGVVNWLLMATRIIGEPLTMTYNLTGVVISMVHVMIPFMIFPILSVLLQIDPALEEAASDLGAGWWRTFRRVTLPLSMQGVVAGCQMVFTLALSAFVTPVLLGGGRVQVLSKTIYESTIDTDWPLAAVQGIFLLLAAMVAIVIFNRLTRAYTYN